MATLTAEKRQVQASFEDWSAKTSETFAALRQLRFALHPGVMFNPSDVRVVDFTTRLGRELTIVRDLFLRAHTDIKV